MLQPPRIASMRPPRSPRGRIPGPGSFSSRVRGFTEVAASGADDYLFVMTRAIAHLRLRNRCLPGTARFAWWRFGCALVLAASPAPLRADEEPAPAVVTNIDTIWAMTAEERARAHPLRLEGRVTFADLMWHNMWFESADGAYYAQLAMDPPALREGMHFVLEGSFVPNEGLSAARTRLTVREEGVEVAPLDTRGRINDIPRFDKRRVTVVGVVDVQQLIDAEHLRVILMVENRPVVCWVRPSDPTDLPDFRGHEVKVTGVYSGRVDPTGNQSSIEVWVAREEEVVPLRPVAELPGFAAPTVSLEQLGAVPLGAEVVVNGVVDARHAGEGLQLRDGSGDVWVRSIQEQVFARGTPVQVAGRVVADRARRVLDEALVRAADSTLARAIEAELARAPGRVERLREMNNEQAAEGRRVSLLGTVTWSHPGLDFFYLADLTGGTRVRIDPQRFNAPPFYKFIRLNGRTVAGPAGPEVVMLGMEDLGARGHPTPLPITVLDAMAGGVEAQWVEMRGFIHHTESDGDWRRLTITSPTGDFVGLLNSPVNFEATPGSLLRIRGVLETQRSAEGLIEEVRLRIPFLHDIHLEEEAPADPFEVPLRLLANLERLSVVEEMIRVRVRGRLVHRCPEGSVVLQDEDHGLEVFTDESTSCPPGSLVEAVGILGREGPRVVLRDAMLRELDSGDELDPAPVAAANLTDPRWESRLVAVVGTVLSRTDGAAGTRLILDSDGIGWDAVLTASHGQLPVGVAVPGSRMRLAGVCRFAYDLQNRPLGFEIELRRPADAIVLEDPDWLTAGRAVVIMGGLALVAGLAAATVLVLRRQVAAQTRLIRQQLERQAALEAELERDHRIRAVGALAGGIAHDFNNLLTVIMGNLSLLRTDERVMAAAADLVEGAESTTARAKGLTNQLVTLARGGAPVTRRVDVGPWLGATVTKALPHGWDLEVEPWHQPLSVQLDEEQMGRAVQTLVKHLVKRESRTGRLNLKLAAVDGGGAVLVELADDGPTPARSQLQALFDPYGESLYGEERFSMALAFSIVRRHGGVLSAEGDRGMVFRIKLQADGSGRVPAADVPQPEAPRPAPVPVPVPVPRPAGSRRVLVLEDEPTVARVVEKIVQRLGYGVEVAADGEACVERFERARRAGTPFAVVLLDLTVPNGMGGVEALARLRALDPAVCAVASSGYSDDPVMANPAQHGFAAVLRKPYQISDMQALLARLTAGAAE